MSDARLASRIGARLGHFACALLFLATGSAARPQGASHVWFPLTSEPLWAELDVASSDLRMGVGKSFAAETWLEHLGWWRLAAEYQMAIVFNVYYAIGASGDSQALSFSLQDPPGMAKTLDADQLVGLLGGTFVVRPYAYGFDTWPPLSPPNPLALGSALPARVGNVSYPRERASDPLLWDAAGSPAAGPRLGGTAVLRIRCKGDLSESLFPTSSGPLVLPPDIGIGPSGLLPDDYQIGVFSDRLPAPVTTQIGTAWVAGDLLGSVTGRINTHLSLPGAPPPPRYGEYRFPIPMDLSVAGTRFYAQGVCAGRASNALGQRVTWTP